MFFLVISKILQETRGKVREGNLGKQNFGSGSLVIPAEGVVIIVSAH